MALLAGSVTVADDGTVSGTGLAKRFWDAFVVFQESANGAGYMTVDPTWDAARKLRFANGLRVHAGFANVIGIIATEITDHAVAHVTNQMLGRTTTAGNPIDPPASPVDVPIQ